jgi:hypothetical protein
MKPHVVACELVDEATVRVWIELSNPNASAVGLVLPPNAGIRDAKPEFDEFHAAWDAADSPGQREVARTQCGPAPGSLIRLEPQQSVTRSVVFPIAQREETGAAYSTVRWSWRQFEFARPYEEARMSDCTLVALSSLEQRHCSVKTQRTVPCPRSGAIDVDLEASVAEAPLR